MNRRLTVSAAILIAAAMLVSGGFAANATVLYNNPASSDGNGSCDFDTTCAATVGIGDVFAAQRFALSSAADVTTADYNILQIAGQTPTSTNWAFYLANGVGGRPGTLVASGSGAATTANGGGFACGPDTCFDYLVNVGSVSLGPGTYYLALQDVSAFFENFLVDGTDAVNPAWETHDGGVTWVDSYNGAFSVSVSVESGGAGSVPEPASLALFGVGLIGFGIFKRRRNRV